MIDTAIAHLAQAAETLRESAVAHKRAAASHRKAARADMRRAAFLDRLRSEGIKVPEDTE